jgi:hypothetical protein
MRRIVFACLFAFMLFLTTSCVTNGYVVYRTYPVVTPHYVYGYTPDGRVFIHTHPHHYFRYYYQKPHHIPFHNHSQHVQPPITPPKPTTVPKATVRQGNNGGSMSGTSRKR